MKPSHHLSKSLRARLLNSDLRIVNLMAVSYRWTERYYLEYCNSVISLFIERWIDKSDKPVLSQDVTNLKNELDILPYTKRTK